jgi:hypothetical protein
MSEHFAVGAGSWTFLHSLYARARAGLTAVTEVASEFISRR